MEQSYSPKRAKEMNKALVSKLGWRLLHEQDSLWTKIVRKKYKVGSLHDRSCLVAKNNSSSTWRSITMGLREVVAPGTSWVIGDGRCARFWSNRWLFNARLMDDAICELPQGHE